MKSTLRNLFFEASYRFGFAEWAIGKPQPDLVKVIDEGALPAGARVLDVGCGTGDNAIYLAERGYHVTGVDAVERAIRTARLRAAHIGERAEFVVGDAMRAQVLPGAPFDAILDSGLLHQFNPPAARAYVAALAAALKPDGKLLVHCFSDTRRVRGPGPHQLSEAELRSCFAEGAWTVEWIRSAEFHSTSAVPYSAWIALVTRAP